MAQLKTQPEAERRTLRNKMDPIPRARDEIADVVVIGAGVVGCAIARALSHHALKVVLLEAGADVGAGTSKASTAILHTGFDAAPGSLEASLVRRGSELMHAYAAQVGIAVERTGALLVAWNEEQLRALPEIRAKSEANGVIDVHLLTAAETYAREPHLARGALGALAIPAESIICPYTPTLALATEAVSNGVELRISARVRAIEAASAATHDGAPRAAAMNDSGDMSSGTDDAARAHRLVLDDHGSTVAARYVVNAAGLGADAVDRLFGFARFTVRPRRGELIVFDKAARSLLERVLLPVPTGRTKGVLVTPTVFGNVLLGPTAEDVDDPRDASTTAAGLASLLDKGRAILPDLLDEEVTATYAGLRAATEHSDYLIFLDAKRRYVCVGGIRSTGISAALGIAEHVVKLLADAGLRLVQRPEHELARVRMPPLGELQARPFAVAERIRMDSDYGRIVCHCERVSRGELRDATCAVVPARSLDGLRRRTRCLQGRCQGFHCLADVVALLAEATGASAAALLALDEDGARGDRAGAARWPTSTS